MRSSQRAVASWASVARWLVMWIQWPGLVPAADDLDGAGVRLGREDGVLAVGLGDAGLELLGLQLVDLPR